MSAKKSNPMKVFKEKLETTYTVLLSRFPFDKTECEQCPFNSELNSIFPDLSKSRCTKHSCLTKKQENHMLDSIIAAVRDEKLDLYISNGSGGSVHSDVVKKLRELGIEVKTGVSHRIPTIPVMPLKEDFEGEPAKYEQAQKDFHIKLSKWNALQKLLENGSARKVVLIDNFEPVPGYVMVSKETETTKAKPDNKTTSGNSGNSKTPGATKVTDSPQSPNEDDQNAPTASVENAETTIKPDLMTILQAQDRKNKEEALSNVIEEARVLIKDTDIPPVDITPFEETLLYFVMLSYLDHHRYDFFGIPEEQTLTEEVALGLYTELTDEQKNVLKRDFLIRHLIIRNGTSKRAALLIELAKHHFPDEMAEIENAHNDDYLEKWASIKEQMDKIPSESEDLKEVA
jgi:ParB family chromosome partitioning protein